MLVKTVSLVVVIAFLSSFFSVESNARDVSVSASSAVLMVASTGEILYSKNPTEKRGIASTTKIMTSIVALENASLTDTITVSFDDINVEGTSMGLKEGDTIDLLSLVKGMLLTSGNDAANVTATLIGGSKEQFASLMNKKAEAIGMTDSSFKNPSGLTEDGHYSCAYDMALLGSYAIGNPVFRSICSSLKAEVTKNDGDKVILYNHNKLLTKYEGAFGIKTGFTKASGRCLVSAVERDGVTLVAVTLNAYDDWNDHIRLYDYYFPLLSKQTPSFSLENISIPVVNSNIKKVIPICTNELFVPVYKATNDLKVKCFLPHFLYAGVKKGDYLGWVELQNKNGKVLKRVYLVSSCDAPLQEYQK